jgi:hypothetical protein
MDKRKKKIIATTTVVAAATAVAIVAVASYDGRSQPNPIRKSRTSSVSMWNEVKNNPLMEDTWFPDNLRCSKSSLLQIADMMRPKWSEIYGNKIGIYGMKLFDILAMTMCHLAHTGGYQQTANIFGLSKPQTVRLVRRMLKFLNHISSNYIALPTPSELPLLERNMYDVAGFPGAVLAVDGTLLEIERPADFEGWYCRKGYPAINMQVVVDYRKRIRSFSIRPGSANDQSIFNRSCFAEDIKELLQNTNYHVLADAGYLMLPYMLTPYEITSTMPRSEVVYNYKHSKTRIVVECALGLLKGRFRKLSMLLNQKNTTSMAELIIACMLVHNLLIDVHDPVPVEEEPILNNDAEESQRNGTLSFLANQKRDQIRDSLSNQ